MVVGSKNFNLDYDPVVFLRCHSKNEDSADFHTQVWHCAFEPNIHDTSETTSVVATCGGNSVCFIDCNTGQVLNKYYAQQIVEQFYTLAWTTLRGGKKLDNILVAGGAKTTLHFINRSANKCVLEYKFEQRRYIPIHTILFHPIDRDILFCGTNDGVIKLGKLDYSNPEDCTFTILKEVSAQSEVFDLTFCTLTNFLLSSCNEGLIGFPFKSDPKKNEPSLGESVNFLLPENPNRHLRNDSNLVDSIEVLGGGLLACKPALHGRIYIFNLNTIKGTTKVKLQPVWYLNWSPTDNYFMYMGYSMQSHLLACGDDKGCLWLYDMGPLISECETSNSHSDPNALIPWPRLNDEHGNKRRKLDLQVYDIVVDKVAIHSSARFLVAVTNNNLVCIWKKSIAEKT